MKQTMENMECNENAIIMALPAAVSKNEGMGEGTQPISLVILKLSPDYVKNEDDDDLRVTFYSAQELSAVSGVITVGNKSHDLYCVGGNSTEAIHNDQPILVITHMTAALPDAAMRVLPEICANIYGIMPLSVVNLSHVLNEDERMKKTLE